MAVGFGRPRRWSGATSDAVPEFASSATRPIYGAIPRRPPERLGKFSARTPVTTKIPKVSVSPTIMTRVAIYVKQPELKRVLRPSFVRAPWFPTSLQINGYHVQRICLTKR